VKLGSDSKLQSTCALITSLSSLPGCDHPEVQVNVARGQVEHRLKAAGRMRTNTLPLSSLPGRDRPEVPVGVARGKDEHRLEAEGHKRTKTISIFFTWA